MKKLLIILLSFLFFTNSANSQSRFGELTEIHDEKMFGTTDHVHHYTICFGCFGIVWMNVRILFDFAN